MKKTILVCGLLVVTLALLAGCHTYDQAYVPADYYGSYGDPAYPEPSYPYYYPYPYYSGYPYYPAYYAYPAYYPYYPYYPYYYYPYFGVGFGFSTVYINHGCCVNTGRGFRGVPSGGVSGRTFRR
jgi:hypothetical protein